ncbi:FBP domain-containing protein [Solicola sp. PLA-1-18]|uniref:FBP domain-containing protein n=1 Tax=Solicola sp. PLA-1-18 TaxID=3380532 RepID=UPI003B817845
MQVPDQQTVRKAFVNSSRSKAASATFPGTWPPAGADELDVVGWTDPKAPRRGYLVLGPEVAGEVLALELRLPSEAPTHRKTMCDLCQTQDAPDGSRLVVAPRAGARGKAGDTVGLYVCTDFGCSLRARQPLKEHQKPVMGGPDLRVPDLVGRLREFVDRVRA